MVFSNYQVVTSFATVKIKIMKKKILLVLIVCNSLAGKAQSIIINSWRDPSTKIQNPGMHKIVVAALIYDQGVHREVEDYMVTLYPGVATQSYQVMEGDSLVTTENAQSQKLKSLGFDGIVIMKQVAENTTQQYIPGQMPSYYNV